MTMIFPQNLLASAEVELIESYSVNNYLTITGKEYRRLKRIKPKREIRLRYDRRYENEIEQVWQFYIDTQGMYNSFLFIFPFKENWEDELIAIGNFNQGNSFELPVADFDYIEIIFNYRVIPSSGYTLYKNTNKRSEIALKYSLGEGVLKCNFDGYPALYMRFAENLNKIVFENMLTTIGIRLVEV